MSEANSGMTLHSLVLISDSFSCNCNSIQTPLSIVHLRVILTYLIPLLRVYINQHSSNAIHFTSSMYSNVTTSTRINSSSVHTYIFVCSTLRVILQGFVDPKCNINYLTAVTIKWIISQNINISRCKYKVSKCTRKSRLIYPSKYYVNSLILLHHFQRLIQSFQTGAPTRKVGRYC